MKGVHMMHLPHPHLHHHQKEAGSHHHLHHRSQVVFHQCHEESCEHYCGTDDPRCLTPPTASTDIIMNDTSTEMKVAIAGLTGKLGRLITKHLLSKPNVLEVHGLARNPDKLPEDLRSNSKLKLFKTDMTSVSSIREAIAGTSILISVILSDPKTELTAQKAMVDACVAENVPRFMPNEFTLDWRTIDLDLLPQKKVNQDLWSYISETDGKVQGVHVLIGGFMETMFSIGFWYDPSTSPAQGLRTWGAGDEIWELTSYDNAAQWAVALAIDPKATGFYKFLGDRLSIKEIAKTLEEVYDLPSIPFTSLGNHYDLREIVEKGMKEKPDSEKFWDWKGQSYTLFLTNGQAYLEAPLDNGKLLEEVEQETLVDWLRGKKLEELSKSAWAI